MKKNRMVVSVVLTAGLGLTGVMAASSSGAATPASAKSTASSKTAASTKSAKSGPTLAVGVQKRGGQVVVCIAKGEPVPGKPLPGEPLPGRPLPGQPLPLPGKPGKPGTAAGKVTVKEINGKLYINGKEVKGKASTDCPAPPFPGKPGKGVVCLQQIDPGKPGHKAGKTTVKSVNGKVYINGKLVPNSRINTHCPPLPPFPGPGKGGVVIKPGQSGTAGTAASGASVTTGSGSEPSFTTVAG